MTAAVDPLPMTCRSLTNQAASAFGDRDPGDLAQTRPLTGVFEPYSGSPASRSAVANTANRSVVVILPAATALIVKLG